MEAAPAADLITALQFHIIPQAALVADLQRWSKNFAKRYIIKSPLAPSRVLQVVEEWRGLILLGF